MTVKRATMEETGLLAQLSLQLWPGHDINEMTEEFSELLTQTDTALFLAMEGGAVGFAQCQLRHDYVEGTDSSPVGYLEGIYVMETCRHRGIARALLAACEDWAREMECIEFASDCELTNKDSLAFHLNVGFEEANRIICFTKKL